jgi:hypothetical protein
MADSILQMLGIRPADVNLLRDRGVPLDQPMPYDPSYQVPGSPPAQRVGDVAGGALSALPSVGDAYSVLQAIADLEAGNYGEAALNGVNALPMVAGMGAIKAFHGSPHKFDAFDMSKIGTGEGAQAYGHGLYFAESEGVAKSYMRDYAVELRRGQATDDQWAYLTNGTGEAPGGWNGQTGSVLDGRDLSPLHDVARAMQEAGGDHSKAAEILRADANDARQYASRARNSGLPDADQADKQALRRLIAAQAIEKNMVKVKMPEPSLYEASLEWPDPAREASDPLGPQHFLDWDKPLSEQPEGVKGALEQLNLLELYGDKTLQGTYSYGIRPAVTNMLKEQGIPGIRYLDAGSRGAGDGTYNYVVFDDKIPKIVSRK